MKLKDILIEQEQEAYEIERARMLTEKFDNFQNKNKTLLYRAENRVLDDWLIRRIRKNRRPKDTANFVDAIVHQLERTYHPSVPRRSGSKFASAVLDKEVLGMYGSDIYIVFPHKRANIGSIGGDAFIDYFQKAQEELYDAVTKYTKFTDLGSKLVEEFIESLKSEMGTEIFGETMDFVKNHWTGFSDHIQKASYEIDDKSARVILNKVKLAVDKINEYFRDIEMGIQPKSKELLFDGPKYMLVERKFFEIYFEWNGSKWQLKQKYQE